MSILKYKYKAHKFINYAFYIVVFIFGFLLGFTTQKLDFNKLISQVLMIDSVSAAETNITIKDNNIPLTEEFIIKTFKELFDEFDINNTPYIYCFSTSGSYICEAVDDEYLNLLYIGDSWNDYVYLNRNSGIGSIFSFIGNQFNYKTPQPTNGRNHGLHKEQSSSINSNLIPQKTPMGVNDYGIYSNFNLSQKIKGAEVLTGTHNILDFEGSDLQFNENLFKDNPDFKEVCIDKGKKYSITTTNIDIVSNSIFVSDFIWFPGKVTGVKYSEYDSLEDDNILVFNDDVSTENYYFKDKEKIDLLYNDEIISNYFIHSGYTDKYSLYGYTAYKFIHSYYVDDDNNSQNMFTIFDFTDMNFSPFGSAGGSSGSFGDTPLTYCFYIKNEFNVTELQTNEWDDYVGTVPTPGGDLDVITSHNKNNSSDKVDSFFSTINNVISELRPTINFIKEHIEQLYLSMPLIVRSFIISFLVLILIRILIGMVVK